MTSFMSVVLLETALLQTAESNEIFFSEKLKQVF